MVELLRAILGRILWALNLLAAIGIVGWTWWQDPKLVKAAFKCNADKVEQVADLINPSGHIESILLAIGVDRVLLFAEVALGLSLTLSVLRFLFRATAPRKAPLPKRPA